PAGEVDEMDALVQQLASARDLGAGPPLALVARTAAMAVTRAQVHQWAQLAAHQELTRAAQGGVESVVEAHADGHAALAGGGGQRGQLCGSPRRRLLDQDVLPG